MPLLASPNRGYADWQRVENWDTGSLWTSSNGSVAGPVTSPAIDVSRIGYLAGYLGSSQNSFIALFAWYTDDGLGVPLGSRYIVCSSLIGHDAQLRIPNMGPYLQVTLTSTTGANFGYLARLWGTNRVDPLELIPNSPFLLDVQNTAIGASAIATLYPTDYYSGPISVWTHAANSNMATSLEVLDYQGTWDIVGQWTPAALNYDFIAIAPPGAWRILVQNLATSSSAYYLFVQPSMTGAA